MSHNSEEKVDAAVNRAYALIDFSIYNDQHKQYEFKKQTVLADKSLTEDVKTGVMRKIDQVYD